MGPRIAVIGAGPLGLMALKNLREEGFDDVTAFEARPYVGGLWKYSTDSRLSCAESTIFNSSKYRSAISDFPFPDDTDDYPTWQQLNSYLNSYADHFALRPYIQLSSPITKLFREDGRWVLEVSPDEAEPRLERFDKVMVAIGSFVTPRKPTLKGIEKFEGKAVHSIDFHEPSQYKGKNVLIIGLHATAQDVACSLSRQGTSKVHISHRNGVYLVRISMPRRKSAG
jgi:dimethylaniline monooxygenase (N-oxide forming)